MVQKHRAWCNWELRIDGKSCSQPSKIGVSMHSQHNDNDHIPVEVVGWCRNIGKGNHRLQIYITRGSGNADCYTGWNAHDYMEAWEPTPAEQATISYMQRVGTDNGSDGGIILRHSFKKKTSTAHLRILYFDNLRVIGHGKWCRWEARVDGKSCPAPLAGSVYTHNSDNDHYPATIVGECPGVSAGNHQVQIYVTRNGGADCYTGWTPGPRVMHALIEVQEGRAVGGGAPQGGKGNGAKLTVARLTRKNNGEGVDQTSSIRYRILNFSKKLSNSVVKVTYAESLRVYGNGKWCRWTIRVDNKDCKPSVYNAKHTTATSDNDHTPHAIVGSCSGLSAGNHRMTIALSRSGGADCYTGWSASGARDAFFMEAEELNPKGQIAVAMRQVGADGRENGWANNRLLTFNKKSSGSQLRLTWASNLRVRAGNNRGGAWCNWELRIDGKSCSQPSKIGVSMHSQQNDNDHIPVEVVGWCRNIGKGNHRLQIYITRGNGNSDCYTGWNAHDYMEAWEPTPAEMATISYMQRVGTDTGSDGSSNILSHSFKKKTSTPHLRILYFDNLRVIGHGRWCRWEARVDGKSCPAPLAGSVYTHNSDNDHYPATIVGECPGVSPGNHQVQIYVTRNGGADCYTGWTPGPRVMHALIEVQEGRAVGGGGKPAIPTKCRSGSPGNCKLTNIHVPGYSPGALVRIHNGRRIRKSTETHSCPVGYKVWSPRNKNDWTIVYNAMKKNINNYPKKPHFIIDVTRPANGCGGCVKYAMKSTTAQQGSWRTTDRSAWWLRDARYNEPNGDYHANCYLHIYDVNPNNVRFNDGSCSYYSTEYLCQPMKGHRRRAEALPTLDLVRADRQMKELPNLEADNLSENFISSFPGVPMHSEVPQKEGDRGGLLKIDSTDEPSLHNHG